MKGARPTRDGLPSRCAVSAPRTAARWAPLESLAASLSLAGAAYADGALRDDARAVALDAVALASTAVPDGLVIPQVTLVSQVHAAAVDLLRTTGVADRESLDLVDEALGGSPD